MYKNRIIKTGAILLLATGICGLLFGIVLASEKYSGTNFKSDDIAVFNIDATVMEVNLDEGYVVIAEKRFNVTEYMVDGKKYTTELTNNNGDEVKMKAFKKGQRVFVRGFELSDGEHIADHVQLLLSGTIDKEYRKIERLKPIGTK